MIFGRRVNLSALSHARVPVMLWFLHMDHDASQEEKESAYRLRKSGIRLKKTISFFHSSSIPV
jgi:hypothetical protein